MEACLLSFIVGNILANNLPILFNVNELLVTMLIIGCAIILRYYKIASVLIGLCSVSVFMQWQSLSPIVANNQAQSLVIQAQIEQLPVQTLAGGKSQQKINVAVNCIYQAEACFQAFWQPTSKLRLSYYRAEPLLQLGQRVKLKVKIKPATSFNNQAGFDFKKWLFGQKIFATGYIQQVEVLSDQSSLKHIWHSQLQKLFVDFQFGDLMLALTTGDRSWIEQNWDVLKNTGTAHLLAISGLHIGLVFLWCYWLVLLILLPMRTSHYFTYQTLAKVTALMMIWLFVYFCQQSIPIVRAAIFISVWVSLSLFRLNWSSHQRFVVALFVVLLLLPLSPLSISFWLSFIAVACVLLVWRCMQLFSLDQHNLCLRIIYLQTGISLLLLPTQVVFFQLIPTGSLLANLIAIPWVTFIILPLLMFALMCLVVIPALSLPLVWLADKNLTWLFESLAWFEGHFVALNASQLSLIFVVLIPAGFLFVYLLRYMALVRRKLMLAGLALIPLAVAVSFQLQQHNKGWRLHMLDVGQGLAILLEDGTSAVLYDTGDRFNSGFNLFEAVVQPVLIARGLSLEQVIVSHADKDHAGGLDAIGRFWPDAHIYQGKVGCEQVNQQNWLNLTWFSWQNVLADNKNNASCVVCISDTQHKVCLTGDIEQQTESWLLTQSQFSQLLPLDVLLIAHHGSRTSSTENFIKASQAEYALISRGALNRFNHPHPQVIEVLQRNSQVIIDSAVDGQSIFYFNPDTEIEVKSELAGIYLPWYKQSIKQASGKLSAFRDDLL
ncbi:DNA internalization-related competence protein ComEC/Rec2 [Catenovulum sp. SX2]|uniref:DNA internalization-related competence protein ComEC/Rec2 n=1 Tax=Catenovulum sp. SX2 TaxID=3398614 RepID=UPI003F82677C